MRNDAKDAQSEGTVTWTVCLIWIWINECMCRNSHFFFTHFAAFRLANFTAIQFNLCLLTNRTDQESHWNSIQLVLSMNNRRGEHSNVCATLIQTSRARRSLTLASRCVCSTYLINSKLIFAFCGFPFHFLCKAKHRHFDKVHFHFVNELKMVRRSILTPSTDRNRNGKMIYSNQRDLALTNRRDNRNGNSTPDTFGTRTNSNRFGQQIVAHQLNERISQMSANVCDFIKRKICSPRLEKLIDLSFVDFIATQQKTRTIFETISFCFQLINSRGKSHSMAKFFHIEWRDFPFRRFGKWWIQINLHMFRLVTDTVTIKLN